MRKFDNLLLMALMWVFGLGVMQAQVVDVCAGNDSVVLCFSNFQYGYVQWQVSDDNVEWSDIDGAIDTVYKFLPLRPRYYRAEVKFPQCSEYDYHSQVTFVQIPPRASAGPDLIIPASTVARMAASIDEGAVGTWSIVSGTGGTLENIHDCHSNFIGEAGEYQIVWTVTNSCGTNADTVSVTCVGMEYQQDLVIVDETDDILSDTLQHVNGEYVIVFNDPVPTINVGTVLLGYRYPSFLRKVVSFERDGDMFIMQTEAGALSDVILSGVLNIDPVEDTTGGRKPNVKYLDRFPTRKEMMENPFLLRDGSIYVLKDAAKECTDFNFNVHYTGGKLTFELVEFDLGQLDVGLTGLKYGVDFSIQPNLRANVVFDNLLSFKELSCGLYDAKVELTHGLRLTRPLSTTLIKREGYFNKNQIMVAGFMIGVIPTFIMVDLPYLFKVQGSLEMGLKLTKTRGVPYTFAMHYNKQTNSLTTTKSKGEPYQYTTIELPDGAVGSVEAKFEVGVKASVLLADVFGPYFGITGNFDPSVCWATGSHDLGGNINMGVDLNLGCRLQLFSHDLTLFDKSVDFRVIDYNEPMPKRVIKNGGDNQVYSLGQYLAQPVSVKVKGWFGTPMPWAYVHFEPTNGGTVTQTKVKTDIYGVASTMWKPGASYGKDNLLVKVYDCQGRLAGETPLTFHAYSSSTDPCLTSGLTVEVLQVGANTVKPKASGGNGSIQYSTNGANYSTTVPLVTTEPGQDYHFYVRDANGCEAEAWYNAPEMNCDNSSLQVGARVDGNTVTIMPVGGHVWEAPYQYSIGGDFQSSAVFHNLYDGEYTATIRNRLGCDKTKRVVVSRTGNLNITLSAINNGSGTANVTTSTSTLIDRGVCWSTHQRPTVQDFRSTFGPGTGSYTFHLEGLDPTKTYYVRAFALDGSGTSYSNEVCISASQSGGGSGSLPTVTATNVNNIGQVAAKGYGNAPQSGSSAVTARGICWSTSPNPTVANSHVACGNGNGAFSGAITGLTPNTQYYARAYATNSVGTAYGPQKEFRTQQATNCTITATASPVAGGTVVGDGTYQQGQSCTLTATANSGYTFANWTESGNVVSTNASFTFTVESDRTLVANFNSNGGGGGSHDYVDLGLPSGLLWATCNVGADNPEDYGDYFAWAETEPKSVYNWSTYKYCDGGYYYKLTKYCTRSDFGNNGFTDNLTVLLPEDDAATANWGNGWRMPTENEWRELIDNTTPHMDDTERRERTTLHRFKRQQPLSARRRRPLGRRA